MRRHMIFSNYCRYYSRHAIVVTTVVTENRMPTHVIFILMSDARCQALFLRKNRPSWATTATTTMTTMQRSAQCSPVQKSGQPSDDECTFLRIRRRRCDNWKVSACGVLSHYKKVLQPRVSSATGTCNDDSSGEMRL